MMSKALPVIPCDRSVSLTQDSQSTGVWGRVGELWRHCVAESVLSSEDLFELEEQVALMSLEGTKTVLASLEELVWQLSGTELSSEVLSR